jgi:hypothetical protein
MEDECDQVEIRERINKRRGQVGTICFTLNLPFVDYVPMFVRATSR